MKHFIQINLTSGLPREKEIYYKYELIDERTKERFIDNLTIYTFNLDKIKERCYNEGKEKYKILATLICDKEELHKICKGDKVLEKLEYEVTRMNKDEKFMGFLTAEEDAIKVHNTLMFNAKEEGSKNKQIEIAKNLLSMNMNKETISKATGLSLKEIGDLK